jgi:hypothetical protein
LNSVALSRQDRLAVGTKALHQVCAVFAQTSQGQQVKKRMGQLLNAISLAIGLAGSAHPSGSGPIQWKDYVWKTAPTEACFRPSGCLPFDQRWDWKRDQWINFSYKLNKEKGLIEIRLQLKNNDPQDDDDVCVTALFLDKKGNDVAVFHENRHSFPGTNVVRSSKIRVFPNLLKSIKTIAIGTKQCRGGPHEDDDLFVNAKTKVGQR